MTPSAPTLPPAQNNVAPVAALTYIHGRAHWGLRPRLAVLGISMDDVVSAAGGAIFDLSMAGWEVTVVAGELDNPRPARILGAGAIDLDTAFGQRRVLQPQALAISGALMAAEDRLRGRVQECLDRGTIEVSTWGQQYAGMTGDRAESTTHRLSHAARVFKQQALRVVRGEVDAVAPTESFRTRATSRSAPQARTGWPVG